VKKPCSALLCLLLLSGCVPARADFKYTDTSKITGGSLKSMVKFASVFNKQASQSLKPTSTTKYVRGNVMKIERTDGSIEIFDLDKKLVIEIDPVKKTYSQATFDEIRDALKKAAEEQKAKMQEHKMKDGKPDNTQVNLNAKVSATPGATGRMINGQLTNEMKVQIDMEVTATQTPDGQTAAQPSGPASGTMSTTVDSWIAPDVSGYQEVGDFYKKMAKEVNWVPPTGITVNPQVSEGMAELQKNESLYKGLPLLQYLSMTMVGAQGSTTDSQRQDSQPSSASSGPPTSASDAVVKGLGQMFGKRKKKDEAPAADANAGSSASNPPPPSSVPGSLIEMTIEVTSFSDAPLDPSLFTDYTRVPSDPNNILGKPAAKK
jgi:hypothetical protein